MVDTNFLFLLSTKSAALYTSQSLFEISGIFQLILGNMDAHWPRKVTL
jgi:hypothetical protein